MLCNDGVFTYIVNYKGKIYFYFFFCFTTDVPLASTLYLRFLLIQSNISVAFFKVLRSAVV